MTDGAPRETVLRRRPATLVAALSSIALMVGLVRNFTTAGTFGIDFGVFYVGGKRIAETGYSSAYDNDSFTTQLVSDHFPALADTNTVSHFISTPTFGWFAQSLSLLPFDASLALWLGAGAVALIIAVRMLDLPWWVLMAVAISPAMALNTMLGQTGPFVLLLFVLMHRAVREERIRVAGALAGLLILKPPMAFGYGLLWLVRRGRYLRSIAVAAVVGVVLSIPTVVGGVDSWRAFLESMSERAEAESSWSQQSPSLPEFLKLLAPQVPSEITLGFWAAGLLGAGVLVVAGVRKYRDDPELLSVVAVTATLLASPHLLVYDTFIVLIPAAVAYHRGILTGDRAGALAAIYAVSLAFGPVLYDMQYETFGRGIGVEMPALLVCVWLLVKWNDQAAAAEATDRKRSAAVLADA